MTALCACGHEREPHAHYRRSGATPCSVRLPDGSWCPCERFRPARARWWQFWRPRLVLGPLTPADLRLLSARPEETR